MNTVLAIFAGVSFVNACPSAAIKQVIDNVDIPGRRLAASDFTMVDPLCEWVLDEGLNTDFHFLDEDELADSVERMLNRCDQFREEMPEEEADDFVNECKLYVHAATIIFRSEELKEQLVFDPKEETPETEYMICGAIVNKINDAMTSEASGVTVVEMDGQDYFKLEEVSTTDVIRTTAKDGMMQALISLGSMLSMAIGTTLVQVCRDFDPIDGHWLRL